MFVRMDLICKYTLSSAMALLSLLAPIRGLLICACVFVGIDFVTGVIASRKRARRQGEPWGFESDKARNTISKLVFIMVGIVMAWLIEAFIFGLGSVNLAKLFTGFVCGVEFWSYLENAAEISDHPIFRWLGKYMTRKIERELDCDLEELKKDKDA